MRFPYVPREVDPLPGVPGSEIIWEPQIAVGVIGPKRTYAIVGQIDTGAALTLIPGFYLERLGAEEVGRIRVNMGGNLVPIVLARVNLALRPTRPRYAWSALVGFDRRRPAGRALWGQLGFLDHFRATFNTAGRSLTLTPNGTFVAPIGFD